MIDEIGNNTLMGCGFKLVKGDHAASEQGPRTLFPPVSGSSSSEPFVDHLLLDQTRLKTELTAVKAALAEEKDLNAKCHEDLLHAFLPSRPNFLLLLPTQFALPGCPLCPQLFALLVCAFDS